MWEKINKRTNFFSFVFFFFSKNACTDEEIAEKKIVEQTLDVAETTVNEPEILYIWMKTGREKDLF